MEQAIVHDIVSHLRNCLPDMSALVQQLAAIESPSTVPESHLPIFARLSEAFAHFNYTTHCIPGRQSGGHLFAWPQNRRRHQPVQVLLGHSDTVWPLGTLKDMPLEIGEGIIRGPGVYDMKAGLVQMLYALEALHALHLEPTVT